MNHRESAHRIEMIDLEKQHAPLREELITAAARVIDSGRYVLGNEVSRFENEFAHSVEVAHAIGCGSGTDALLLALLAAGVEPGQRVLCPAYSFFATASTIARLGARPVFVDIESNGFNADPSHARQVIDAAGPVDSIVVADLFGRVASMGAFRALADELGVALIEDAAQSVLARDFSGSQAGTIADMGCFSFYPTKNLGALGEAGAVVTMAPALDGRLRSLRSHGAEDPVVHRELGLNARLDALHAAMLGVKLGYLEKWTEARRANAASYRRGLLARLGDLSAAGIKLPAPETGAERHVHHQFVVRVTDGRRDPLRAHLDEHGISSAIFYPLPLHLQPSLADLGEAPLALPHAEAAAKESVALPIHPGLLASDLDRVMDGVASFFDSA